MPKTIVIIYRILNDKNSYTNPRTVFNENPENL